MSNTPSADTDPWDRPPLDDGGRRKAAAAASARHKERAAPSNAIPDDWDEETSSGEEDNNNQTIWDNANKQVPMPQLVVTSPRTGSISPGVVPPASAFQSPIRILKRSTAPTPAPTPTQKKGDDGSSPTSSPPVSAAPMSAGTFAERSARYNAARERIFAAGSSEASMPVVGSTGEGVVVTGGVGAGSGAIIRNPKGPDPVQGPNGQGREGSQGFGMRTGKRGGSGQPNDG